MNIAPYIDAFAQKRHSRSTLYDMKTARNLLKGDNAYALVQQEFYAESEYLAHNIKMSVRGYLRNKDIAISIYKDFLAFIKAQTGLSIEVSYPPIAVSNNFERLMFIAKYLQDPRHTVANLSELLWVSERALSDDIKRLQGNPPEERLQVCGKAFTIDAMERRRGGAYTFASTAHPLFLTPNLTQVLVTLKGLKVMADNPLYAEYARLAATDIWEQLSDYAKTRIHFVLSELMPEDLGWYESLRKKDGEHFYSEVRCSGPSVVLDCMKNGKFFCAEYDGPKGTCLYRQCRFIPSSYNGDSIEVETASGRVRLSLDKIIRSAYTAEELL